MAQQLPIAALLSHACRPHGRLLAQPALLAFCTLLLPFAIMCNQPTLLVSLVHPNAGEGAMLRLWPTPRSTLATVLPPHRHLRLLLQPAAGEGSDAAALADAKKHHASKPHTQLLAELMANAGAAAAGGAGGAAAGGGAAAAGDAAGAGGGAAAAAAAAGQGPMLW